MKIAFDCKGTLEGGHEESVVKLFKHLEAQGHEMIIWSSIYSYTLDQSKRHELKAILMGKVSKMDVGRDKSEYVDIAIDDQPESIIYLAVKKMIDVRDIPENESDFEAFLKPYMVEDKIVHTKTKSLH